MPLSVFLIVSAVVNTTLPLVTTTEETVKLFDKEYALAAAVIPILSVKVKTT
jgi:hypothetical protein